MKARLKIMLIFCLLITLSGCITTMDIKKSEKNTEKLIEEEPESRASKEISEDSAVINEIELSTERNVLQDSSEYVAKNEGGLSFQDSETAYELCVRALTDYYKAVWNGSVIELDTFIDNEYLRKYTQNKIQFHYDVYGKFNDKVQNIEINDWEVESTDDLDGGFLYLKIPAEIKKSVGSYGEVTEFLVRNVNGKLVIVDWYTGAKDSYDFLVRGENLTIDNAYIWNDSEWVKELNSKQVEFSGSIRQQLFTAKDI